MTIEVYKIRLFFRTIIFFDDQKPTGGRSSQLTSPRHAPYSMSRVVLLEVAPLPAACPIRWGPTRRWPPPRWASPIPKASPRGPANPQLTSSRPFCQKKKKRKQINKSRPPLSLSLSWSLALFARGGFSASATAALFSSRLAAGAASHRAGRAGRIFLSVPMASAKVTSGFQFGPVSGSGCSWRGGVLDGLSV